MSIFFYHQFVLLTNEALVQLHGLGLKIPLSLSLIVSIQIALDRVLSLFLSSAELLLVYP